MFQSPSIKRRIKQFFTSRSYWNGNELFDVNVMLNLSIDSKKKSVSNQLPVETTFPQPASPPAAPSGASAPCLKAVS